MKEYISLLRVKHYIKNFLIFAPLFFGGIFFDTQILLKVLYSFLPFCLGTSVVYIINDIRDAEKDRRHPVKCKRPIASGAISVKRANIFLLFILLLTGALLLLAVRYDILPVFSIILLCGYVVLNLLYSMGLKNVMVIDILILAVGFVIRLYYGACVADVEVSSWLYLTVVGGAFYLGIGKRRNELGKLAEHNTREVLKKYNYDFLDKNMHVCLAFTEVCYALWAVQSEHKYLMWTVPIVMVIFMKYSLDIETGDSDANPTEVLLGDKILIGLVLLYVALVFFGIYFA